MSMFDTTTVPHDVDSIVIGQNIKNIRTYFDRERVEELAEAIKRDGLMVPLVVMPGEDEEGEATIELVAGERRLQAIRLIRRDDSDFMEEGVPCVTYAGTYHDAKYVNASENIDREDVDEVDISAWIYGRTQEGVKQGEIADRLHRSKSWVSQRVTFHVQASDDVKQALREGWVGFIAAYELSKNLSKEEQDQWLVKAQKHNEKITVEDARNAGDKDKEKRPGKKARRAILARADRCVASRGSEVAAGLAHSLRWVDGDISDDEIDEILCAAEA
jgi:ParB/RepB/Spo0J family partition protein